jgi:D-tyrosyl-tRNA(Tyr) deacylase
MKAVIQRVSHANVQINQKEKSRIDHGILILLGIGTADDINDIAWLSNKIASLRIFDDHNGVMNLSVCDVKASILLVSQFTLCASTKKGNRPSFIGAAKPEVAKPLYEVFIAKLEEKTGIEIQQGSFGANMQVTLCNDGPVTIIMDSKNRE